MMTPKLKACFKRATKDKVFIEKIKRDEPDFEVPGFFGCDIDKSILAATYYGYILGRDGEYID